jgi:hypothetical protein
MLIGQRTTWNVQMVLLGFLQVKKQWMDDSQVHYVQHFMFIYIIYVLFSLQIVLSPNASFLTKCMFMLSLSKTNIIEVFSWHFNQRKAYGVLFLYWFEHIVIPWFCQKKVIFVVCIYMYIFMALSFRLLVAFWHKATTTTQNILWLIEIIARSWVKIKWS